MKQAELSEEERAGWALVASVPAVGSRGMERLRAAYGLISKALNDQPEGWKKAGLSESQVSKLSQQLENILPGKYFQGLVKRGIKVVTECDEEYPPRLTDITYAPSVLFVRGKLDPEKLMVAVVGTRKPTGYGRRMTEEIAHVLALNGVVVVSGLAYGVDATAHKAAMDAGGETVAVLGNGVDRIYPAANNELGHRIIRQGALVSEYPPGYPALRQNFPARNRIISGMCAGVVVVEGEAKSGSRITAEFARKQGRVIMAVPGDVNNPMSQASNDLIRAGAKLVRNGEEVLEELNVSFGRVQTRKIEFRNNAEAKIFELLQKKPSDVDGVAKVTQLSVKQVMERLSLMEVEGWIERGADGKYLVQLTQQGR